MVLLRQWAPRARQDEISEAATPAHRSRSLALGMERALSRLRMEHTEQTTASLFCVRCSIGHEVCFRNTFSESGHAVRARTVKLCNSLARLPTTCAFRNSCQDAKPVCVEDISSNMIPLCEFHADIYSSCVSYMSIDMVLDKLKPMRALEQR